MRHLFLSWATAAFLAAGAGASSAAPFEADRAPSRPAASATIPDGRATLAPLAFIRFCISRVRGCEADGREGRVELTSDRLKELLRVNREVNGRIRALSDVSVAAAWSVDAQAGNCNTFAIQKRDQLLGLSWPVGSLSLAVVVTPDSTGHLVLVVRTSRGDMVLDNLRSEIVPWNATNYAWRKVQSEANPQDWRDVRPTPGMASRSFAAL